MKKNPVITFFTACLFGAGQMYLGYLKRGVSLMCLAIACPILMHLFHSEVLMFPLVIIFAYSFFDTWRIFNFTQEEKDNFADEYFIHGLSMPNIENYTSAVNKQPKIIAYGCFALAGLIFYNSVILALADILARYINGIRIIAYNVPQYALIAALVWFGYYLLRRPQQPQDYTPYEGEIIKEEKPIVAPVYIEESSQTKKTDDIDPTLN